MDCIHWATDFGRAGSQMLYFFKYVEKGPETQALLFPSSLNSGKVLRKATAAKYLATNLGVFAFPFVSMHRVVESPDVASAEVESYFKHSPWAEVV